MLLLSCLQEQGIIKFQLCSRSLQTNSLAEILWVEKRMQTHVGRVRDVELLTGLDFYHDTKQPLPDILQLKTFLPTFETLIY